MKYINEIITLKDKKNNVVLSSSFNDIIKTKYFDGNGKYIDYSVITIHISKFEDFEKVTSVYYQGKLKLMEIFTGYELKKVNLLRLMKHKELYVRYDPNFDYGTNLKLLVPYKFLCGGELK